MSADPLDAQAVASILQKALQWRDWAPIEALLRQLAPEPPSVPKSLAPRPQEGPRAPQPSIAERSGLPPRHSAPCLFSPGDLVGVRLPGLTVAPRWPGVVQSLHSPEKGKTSTMQIAVSLVNGGPTDLRSTLRDPFMASVKTSRFWPFVSDLAEDAARCSIEDTLLGRDARCAPLPPAFIEDYRAAAFAATYKNHLRLTPRLCAERSISMEPIGVVISPYRLHKSAPRQPRHGSRACNDQDHDDRGFILLDPAMPSASTKHLGGFEHIWVIYHFNYAACWKAEVIPPRDDVSHGVLATRSPHRKNAIGLSVVKLEAVDGYTLQIRRHDILHGTPVLDIKPYIPYCDAISPSKAGWVDSVEDRRRKKIAEGLQLENGGRVPTEEEIAAAIACAESESDHKAASNDDPAAPVRLLTSKVIPPPPKYAAQYGAFQADQK